MHLPTPPPWMADLPALHHQRAKAFQGLPSHAASQWVAGKPVFSVDQRKLRVLAVQGRCWQCGYRLALPDFVIVTETDITNRYGALHTQEFGPLHRSCALYAAAACPFLRYPMSRRRIIGHTQRGAAYIHGFNHFGVFYPPHPMIFPLFGYFSPTATIRLTSQERVADLYEQALITDTATDFTDTPPLSWTDTPDDTRRLAADWSDTRQKILAAQTSHITINDRTYRGRLLDQSQPKTTCRAHNATAQVTVAAAQTSSPAANATCPDHQPDDGKAAP